ncbi:MAG TPA: tetratricopeptide repeat protein [Thermoanaerobaculia bacterium]|nr:tetratricopeptide repeat protein [Thermoanaerobaculia bacterium]
MADYDLEARLRDLKKRVEHDPRSRFFVPLAEEYRRAGRLPEAIKALEGGLAEHPGYVAARVALGRALLETGRIEEAMDAFSKALTDDPSNLVAAKALGDIHLSRGEPMEALKRYLRFRAVSGDRRVDDVIAKLRDRVGPSPEPLPAPTPAVFPPVAFPPAPIEPVVEAARAPRAASPLPPVDLWPAPPTRRETDPFDITSVPFERPGMPPPGAASPEPAEEMLSRDVRLDAVPADDVRPSALRLPEAKWPFEAPPESDRPPSREGEPPLVAAAPEQGGSGASGRTLAELYFEQGHDADAIRVADDLLVAIPGEEGLERLRDEAARRLAGSAPEMPPPVEDPGRERRLAKVRILNQWLDAVSERSRA